MTAPLQIVRDSLRRNLAGLLIACLAAAAAGMTEPVIPTLIVSFISHLLGARAVDLAITGTLIAAILANALFRLCQRVLIERASSRIAADVFTTAMRHLLSRPLTWFWTNHSGGMQVRLERSTRGLVEFVKLLVTEVLPPVANVVMAIMMLSRRSPSAVLVATAVLFGLVVLTAAQILSQAGIRVRINRAREFVGESVAEAAGGIEQVKLFGAEAREASRVGNAAAELARAEYAHHRIMASFDVAKQLVERGGLIAMLLWACLWPVSGGPPSFDAIVTVMLLFDRMFEPVRHLHRLVDEGHERWTLCRDLLDILAVPPVSMRRIADPGHPLDADVEGLSFTYPGRDEPVLHNVSLRIAPGQHAAVVGRSGSGKSTLGRLLAGLLPPDQGSILIGGVDPFAQRGAAWLPPVGYMTQEPYIFAGTIFENVRFAHPDSTEDQVKAALILAGLPEMAETGRLHGQCLGQGGAGLSGGQKQRVMLARVLLLKPRFIIFDEPSSALDPYAAKRFFSDVLAALDGSTVLVITHHTSDLAWADVVLEFGDAGLSVHANIDTYRPSGSLTPSTALSLAIQ